MTDTAKLFKPGRGQAVRLPKAFRMPALKSASRRSATASCSSR